MAIRSHGRWDPPDAEVIAAAEKESIEAEPFRFPSRHAVGAYYLVSYEQTSGGGKRSTDGVLVVRMKLGTARALWPLLWRGARPPVGVELVPA